MNHRPKYKFGDSEANFRPTNQYMYGGFSIGDNFYVSTKRPKLPYQPPELSRQTILQTKITKKFSELETCEFLLRDGMPFYGMDPNYENAFFDGQLLISSYSSYIKSVNAE
jgi:hypothetical protein